MLGMTIGSLTHARDDSTLDRAVLLGADVARHLRAGAVRRLGLGEPALQLRARLLRGFTSRAHRALHVIALLVHLVAHRVDAVFHFLARGLERVGHLVGHVLHRFTRGLPRAAGAAL